MRALNCFSTVAMLLSSVAVGCVGPAGVSGDPGPPGVPGESSGTVTEIPLFGENFFPEGIAATTDGTLFVGSVGTGEIVRIPPGATKPEAFVPAGTLKSAVGMLADEVGGVLWVCYAGVGETASGIANIDLATGQVNATYDFPAGGRRLPAGGSALEEWSADPRFARQPGKPGVNGIAWDGQDLYVVKTFEGPMLDGAMFRIAIDAGGAASTVTRLTPDKLLGGPDGIRELGPGRFLLIDNPGGTAKHLTVAGDAIAVMTLDSGLDSPTTAALADGDAWVPEGQLDHFFGDDPAPPNLPFMVKRVYLP